MEDEKSKLIRISPDAYNSLSNLKELIGNKVTYADLILVETAITRVVFDQNPAAVRSMANAARLLRLKKKRGEDVDILEFLIAEYKDSILGKSSGANEIGNTVVDVIELLLNDGHTEAATTLLFNYKHLISEEQFKELSAKILEKQMELKRELESE